MFNQAAYSDSENPANTRLYDTGWSGVLTFAEIMQAIAPIAAGSIRTYVQVSEQELQDRLQRGFMVLWQRLQANPLLLQNACKVTVSKIVVSNGGKNYFARVHRELIMGKSEVESHWDEYLTHAATRSEVWAAFATRADLHIDIQLELGRLAEEYLLYPAPHNLTYLAALYFITTSVVLDDAAKLAGCAETVLRRYIKAVRHDLQTAFAAHYQPNRGWYEKYLENPEPALRLLEKMRHSVKRHALQWLLDGSPEAERAARGIQHYHTTPMRRALERAYHTNH